MISRRPVQLLRTYDVQEPTTLVFANRDALPVPPGVYYPCAFGVVINAAGKFLTTTRAAWKLSPQRLVQ